MVGGGGRARDFGRRASRTTETTDFHRPKTEEEKQKEEAEKAEKAEAKRKQHYEQVALPQSIDSRRRK